MVWYWQEARHTYQLNNSQFVVGNEVNWFLTRVPGQFNKVFSINDADTTGYPNAKKWNWTPTSYHIQNSGDIRSQDSFFGMTPKA